MHCAPVSGISCHDDYQGDFCLLFCVASCLLFSDIYQSRQKDGFQLLGFNVALQAFQCPFKLFARTDPYYINEMLLIIILPTT